jgi:hypothetical protein
MKTPQVGREIGPTVWEEKKIHATMQLSEYFKSYLPAVGPLES